MKTKRLFGLLLAITMLVSMMPAGFAASPADFVDFPTGWSKEAVQAAVNNGLLYGFDNGEIRPQANLTRAEMAAVITRSFGAVTKADISAYTDVSASSWYYDSIAKAVKMGVMQGESSNKMSPDNPITREELFTVFARVLVLSSSDTTVLGKFKDSSKISSWAKEHMAALVERGYVKGDDYGNVNPGDYITREEFAQVMHNAIRTYIAEPGTYTKDMEGITVIRVPDVTVKNLVNTSDLVIGDGVGTGNIYITGLKIGERLLARGGTITIKSTTLDDKVVVNNVNGITHFNNYRDEKIFDGIVENTEATFLKRGIPIMGGSSTPATTHKITFKGDTGDHYSGQFTEGTTLGYVIQWVEDNIGKPEKADHDFAGWTYENNAPIDPSATINGPLVIVPVFEKRYTVTYLYQDGSAVNFSDAAKFEKYSKVTVADYILPTKDDITNIPSGQYFVGLYREAECYNGVANFQTFVNNNYENKTIYVKTLAEGEGAIKYQNAADFPEVNWNFINNATVDTKYTALTQFPIAITANNVQVNSVGYKFKGWVDENGISVTEIVAPAGFPLSISEINIYADFELISYNFEIKGYDENKAPIVFSYKDGYAPATPITVRTLPELDEIKAKIEAPVGYEFDKWVDENGTEVTDITSLLSNEDGKTDVKLYAQFKLINYSLDVAGCDENGNPLTFTFKDGYAPATPFTVKSIPELNAIKENIIPPANYEFDKWVDSNGREITDIESLLNNSIDGITIYVQFKKVTPPVVDETVTVNFEDKEGTPIGAVEIDKNSKIGNNFPNVAAKEGHNVKWYDKATGNEVNADTTVGSDTVVYYDYIPYEYTMKIAGRDAEDGTTVDFTGNKEIDFDYDDIDTLIEGISIGAPLGYTFEGLYNGDALLTKDMLKALEDGETININALFKAIKYTIKYYVNTYDDNGVKTGSVDAQISSTWEEFYTYTVKTENPVGKLPSGMNLTNVQNNFEFAYWTFNNTGIGSSEGFISSFEEIIAALGENETTINLYAHCEEIAEIVVTFIDGYIAPDDPDREDKLFFDKIGTVTVHEGNSLKDDNKVVPEPPSKSISSVNYKSEELVSLYSDGEYVHKIVPTYWYVDENGKMVAFDEDVVVNSNMDVYLMLVKLSFMVEFESNGTPISVSAEYSDETRVVDSFKDMMIDGRNQLEKAIAFDLIPKYDELKEKILGQLIDKDVIDSDNNIKMTEIAIPISQLVKEEIAEGMVKQFIRDTINNPNELDKVLQFIDIDEFISQLDISAIIDSLSNKQIAELIKAEANRSTVIGFIMDDLKSDDSKMISVVISYIKNNKEFRDGIVDELMAALMNKNDTSTLKMSAIDYLKNALLTDGSELQSTFATMLIDSLTGTNPNKELKDKVIGEIQTNDALKSKFADMLLAALKSDEANDMKAFVIAQIKGNAKIQSYIADLIIADLKNKTVSDDIINHIKSSDELITLITNALKNGNETLINKVVGYIKTNISTSAELRKAILTSDNLTELLKDAAMKEKVMDLLFNKEFITEALSDKNFRTTMIDAVINEEDFLDALIHTEQFKKAIIGELHTGALAEDVKELLESDSAFKAQILDEVKKNEDFLELIGDHGALHDVVLGAIKWEEYIENEDDLLRYILNQSRTETTDYSAIITEEVKAEIENIIETEYNSKLKPYNDLTATEKQTVKDELYKDQTVKDSVYAKAIEYNPDIELAIEMGLFTKDDLFKFIFNQPDDNNVIEESGMVTQDDVAAMEKAIGEEFDKSLVPYDQLSDADKQKIKDQMYSDETVKTQIITNLKEEFEAYKETMLDKLIAGEEFGDAHVDEVVDNLLVDYVNKYISKDESLDSNVAAVIESILLDYISEMVTGIVNKEESELTDFEKDVISVRDSYVNDAGNVSEISQMIVDFTQDETHKEMLKTLITDEVYKNELVPEIVALVKSSAESESAIYSKIEETMISIVNSIDSKVLGEFVKANSSNPQVTELIQTYIVNGDVNELKGYIADFINSDPNYEATVREQLSSYIVNMSDSAVEEYITSYAKDPNKAADITNMLKDLIGGMSYTEIETYLDQFITSNKEAVQSLAIDVVKGMTNSEIAGYLADFLNGSKANQDMVRAEVEKFFNDESQMDTVQNLAKTYLTSSDNKDAVEGHINEFIATQVNEQFVEANKEFIKGALAKIDSDMLSQFVDEQFIKDYVAGLSETERINFSNKIFETIITTKDYKEFMHSLFNEETFTVTTSNYTMVSAVANAIGNLSYDSVMAQSTDNTTVKALLDLLGDKVLRQYFDRIKNDYVDGLNEALARVNATGVSEEYTTSLNLKINVIDEILVRLYNAAQPKVEEKLENAGVKYEENKFVKYLVEHDMIANLLSGSAENATDELTGYSLKGVMDYYEYLLRLALVGDDAITWYGKDENITDEEFNSVYYAAFGKLEIAHGKLNEIIEAYLADGTLPSKVKTAIEKIEQVNDLLINYQSQIKDVLTKYLNHEINLKIESGELKDDERVIKVVDLLFGKEEPTITIDTLYNIFYQYDDNVQAKLQELKESGKLEKAIEKFENTSFGTLFSSNETISNIGEKIDEIKETGKVKGAINKLYDLFVLLADYGVEPFKVESNDVKKIDEYEVNINGITLNVSRRYN